jgi:hypothetical protein
MTTRNESGWKTYQLGTGFTPAAYRGVTGNTVDGISFTGAGQGSRLIGFIQELTTSVDPDQHVVRMKNAPGTVIVEVTAALNAGQKLYCAADGKFTPVPAGKAVLRAETAASGSGSEIEATPIEDGADNLFDIIPLGDDAITAAELAATDLVVGMKEWDTYGNEYTLCLLDNVNAQDAFGIPVGVRTAGVSEFDLSDDLAASAANKVRGLTASRFTGTDVYGWVMTDGQLETALDGVGMSVVTDGNVAAGQGLIWGADGVIHGVTLATPTDCVYIGQAPVADTATALGAGIIKLMMGNVAA